MKTLCNLPVHAILTFLDGTQEQFETNVVLPSGIENIRHDNYVRHLEADVVEQVLRDGDQLPAKIGTLVKVSLQYLNYDLQTPAVQSLIQALAYRSSAKYYFNPVTRDMVEEAIAEATGAGSDLSATDLEAA
jgi:hypothetical protein